LVDSLHEESKLLRRLVDDLQELSLAEASHLRLNQHPMWLHEVMETIIKAWQPFLSS
jgi:two-component system sensor histidine kinase BaeS